LTCNPERVTAYVDRELWPRLEHPVLRHLAACPTCAAQALLSEVFPPHPRPGFAVRVMAAVLSQSVSAQAAEVAESTRAASEARLTRAQRAGVWGVRQQHPTMATGGE
jgi:hypothetical protein